MGSVMTSLVELHNLNELSSRLRANSDMRDVVLQGVDINPVASDFWAKERSIYPIIEELADGRRYDAFVTIADTTDEVISFLKSHPPIPV